MDFFIHHISTSGDLNDVPYITAPNSINTLPRPLAKHQIIFIYKIKSSKTTNPREQILSLLCAILENEVDEIDWKP